MKTHWPTGATRQDWRDARNRLLQRVAVFAFISVTSGCALRDSSPISAAIGMPPAGDLQLAAVYTQTQAHLGSSVRWGGNIIAVEHDSAGNALVQVLERRLDDGGRPIENSPSAGRFAIRATADVDPQFYARDRLITIAGTVVGNASTRIDDKNVTVPLVEVDAFALWLPSVRDPYLEDYWYGPLGHFGMGRGNFQNRHRPPPP